MRFNRLREARLYAKKSQREVAEFLNMSPQKYALYEKGQRNFSPDYYRILASYYGVDLNYLMGADLISNSMDDNTNFAKTEEERELLTLFRNLSPYLQDLTLSNVRSWSNAATKVYRDNRR